MPTKLDMMPMKFDAPKGSKDTNKSIVYLVFQKMALSHVVSCKIQYDVHFTHSRCETAYYRFSVNLIKLELFLELPSYLKHFIQIYNISQLIMHIH